MDYLFSLLILVCLNSISAQQYYDKSDCPSDQLHPGSRYTCNTTHQQHSCKTFLVYRANRHSNTTSKIAALFNSTTAELRRLNNLTSSLEPLRDGTEVLVPIDCSCSGGVFRSNLTYIVAGEKPSSLSSIACGVFEGLVKPIALSEENGVTVKDKAVEFGSTIRVPLKCACPEENSTTVGKKGIKYLVTYPFVEGDGTILVSKKFGISAEDLWEVNHLSPKPTVYPITTVLVPIGSEPEINRAVVSFSPPPASAGFLPTTSVEEPTRDYAKPRNVLIAGTIIGFSLLILVLIVCFLRRKASKKQEQKKYRCIAGKISSPVCLSPDLLAGINKFTLVNYSAEAIERATEGFGGGSTETRALHKGSIESVVVMIKETRLEEARRVAEFQSRINHVNVVKLIGVCYGDENIIKSRSYLVFEYPENGSLRDCLSDPTRPLRWSQRVQIAFGVATALHYLHRCISPSYVHSNLRTRTIFLTSDYRARLGEIGGDRTGSEKGDIYGFGVVVLELISGRENGDDRINGSSMKECVGFLGNKSSGEGGWFEKLRSFVDPRLSDEYSLAEALCLAVLAKACLEDDPMNRPSMDDIIKVISRMV